MPHYFDPSPSAASRPSTVRLALGDVDMELVSDTGVFSAAAVDVGTFELLSSKAARSPDPGGEVLDLGCGYGPIALTMASRWPASRVWATDVNERALSLTAANASALGLANVHAVRADDIPADLRFDRVLSNPPIRIGKASLQELLAGWLGRLTPTGRAWLVVHKHLGSDSVAAWLRASGHAVEKLSSRKGYRILEVLP